MKSFLVWVFWVMISAGAAAQGFEITGLQDSYKGTIGQEIRAPLYFKNNSPKSVTLIIRKSDSQIGTSQKNFFCKDGICLDRSVEDLIVKVEAGQTLSSLQVALEAGLAPGISSVKYIAYNKSNPAEAIEFELNFVVDEEPEKTTIYNSRFVTLQDVYPNPAVDYAFVDYKILQDQIKAKIVVHNVLGNQMSEYELSAIENKAKIITADLNAGIYFYTLHINGEAVVTRKLIVKK